MLKELRSQTMLLEERKLSINILIFPACIVILSIIDGIEDVVMCIPHRGRQNLLVGLLNYSHAHIFSKVLTALLYPNCLQ